MNYIETNAIPCLSGTNIVQHPQDCSLGRVTLSECIEKVETDKDDKIQVICSQL
eukprot:gnl/Chilomastix_caulleri/6332.p2 GENE.gnl/Chilomastix_caulleri/6332~~gnl/Chilomastix_caulleri/6332.p2  ORF type:complete len:54 (+),score=10.49 gnl/Chilomastix_caulleri/6332:157-318(+)